jgi:hypothetical protein
MGGFPIYVHMKHIGGFQTKKYTFVEDRAVLVPDKKK